MRDSGRFVKGHIPWNKCLTPQEQALSRRKQLEYLRRYNANRREQMIQYLKNYHEKNKEKLNAQCRANWKKNREKRREYKKQYNKTRLIELKRHRGVVKKGSPEYCAKMSEHMKTFWKNEVLARKLFRGWRSRPNKLEQSLIRLVSENKLPFKYVGDGTVIIDGRCPDFINNNGRKQVIELFGDYWHNPSVNPNVRPNATYEATVNHYQKFGFDCLILWEHEMENEEKVIETIKSFCD